jgi:uncharacterized repeat protein (TIGR01451 family)
MLSIGVTGGNWRHIRVEKSGPADLQAAPVVDVQLVADTEVTKAVLTDPVVPGQPVQFRLTVLNRGPSVALTPVVSDSLAPGLTFIGPTDVCEVTREGGVVVGCRLPNLAVGASTELILEVGTDLNHTDADTILVIAQPAPTTTRPSVPTTTVQSGSGSGGGSLPVVGAAIAGLLAIATLLVLSGGGLRAIAAGPRSRRRRSSSE